VASGHTVAEIKGKSAGKFAYRALESGDHVFEISDASGGWFTHKLLVMIPFRLPSLFGLN
jgi:hypothetical protein